MLAGRDSSGPAIGCAEVGEEGAGECLLSICLLSISAKDPGFSASGWPGPAATPAEGYVSPWGSVSALAPSPLSPLLDLSSLDTWKHLSLQEPATGGLSHVSALSPHTHGQLHPGQKE